MKIAPADEIQRLYDLEYGERGELTVRLIGVVFGNALLVLYTQQPMLWAWSTIYLSIQLGFFLYLRRYRRAAGRAQLVVASCLFLCLMTSFLWVPAWMMAQDGKPLFVVGSALTGSILVFLVRRCDTMPELIAGQVMVVAALGGWVLVALIGQVETWLEQVGIVLSGCALIGYFGQALLSARRQRLQAVEAATRSLQAQKLTAIGQLAGGVAHDFNNNLTAILGNLELVQVLEDGAERDACLDSAIAASHQAARTVRQLLVYARKEPMQVVRLDPAALMRELDELTRRLIPTSVATLFPAPDHLPAIRADKGQLLTALINLVTNAVDAMPDGGRLEVSAESLDVTRPLGLRDGTQLTRGRYVVFRVADTGQGIPPELLDKVLEPFFTTKPVGKGTGLGLAMVLGVARKLDGGMNVDSSPKGTAVSVFIPAEPAPVPGTEGH